MESFFASGVVLIKKQIVNGFLKKQLWRQRVTKIIAITGSLILIIAALSYYGMNVGSFVISLRQPSNDKSLMLSIDEDMSNQVSRLNANPLADATDTEYCVIDKNIDNNLGEKHQKNAVGQDIYFAYSFYLINAGKTTTNYLMSFNIQTATRRIDSILRVMIIEDGVKTIYAKAREDEGHIGEPTENVDRSTGEVVKTLTTPFLDDRSIIKKEYHDFDKGDVKKYTIVMWLDGWDLESDNSMLGGALRLNLDFYVL